MLPERYREAFAQHRWEVPAEFNIATVACRRYAVDRSRFAMYWEDETGMTAALTFWDLQQQANRLSNALAELGVGRGDAVAIILPQRPETAIAHVACYQMGAVAVPLSFLFGPDALEYRLHNAEARVAVVDSASLPNLAPIRQNLPLLTHAIGLGGGQGRRVV
jgi:acetyl-CoA synthetase